jgi:GTP-binding protein
VTDIDKRLAQLAFQKGKGGLWVITKWDRVQKAFTEGTLHGFNHIQDFQRSFSEAVRDAIPFLSDIPLVFTSAERREGLHSLLSKTHHVYQQGQQRWPTPQLNRWLGDCLGNHPPPSHNGKFFRAYYLVQVGVNPITVRVFCNRRRWLSPSYRRFLENSFRDHFHLTGCPVFWIWTEKPS